MHDYFYKPKSKLSEFHNLIIIKILEIRARWLKWIELIDVQYRFTPVAINSSAKNAKVHLKVL